MSATRPQIPVRRWLLVTFVLWGVTVGLTLRNASNNLNAAKTEMDSLRSLANADDLTTIDFDDIELSLARAEVQFSAATTDLDQLYMEPLRVVPIARTNLASVRALSQSSLQIVSPARRFVAAANELGKQDGDLDTMAVVSSLAAHARALEAVVAAADAGPTEGLLGRLVDARNTFEEQRFEIQPAISDVQAVLSAVEALMLDSDYLIMGANNAEMRLAQGMTLSVGVLSANDGELTLSPTLGSDYLYPVLGTRVVDEDIEQRWGFLSPANDYRKVGYSARFAEYSGPQAQHMWATQMGQQTDGIAMIDPFVFQAILDVVGPVELEGKMLDSSNVLEYLLIGQYEEFGEKTLETQTIRRESLALLSATTFAALDERPWNPIDLASQLKPLIAGRHLLLYSSDPVQQAGWDAMGATGRLTGDEAGVFLLNLNAGKNDPFMDVAVEVLTEKVDEGTLVTLSTKVANRMPDDISAFALGNWDSIGVDKGVYVSRFVVYAPARATDVKFVVDRPLEVFGPDGQVWVMGTRLDIRQGETELIEASFILPDDVTEFSVVPSARYPTTNWTIDGLTRGDSELVIDIGGNS